MCVGSSRSRKQEPAVAGVQYRIGKTHYHDTKEPDRQGVIYAEGCGYEPQMGDDRGKIVACAACIKAETSVELCGIPLELQKRLGIGPVESATFVPGSATSRRSQDKIRIGIRLFKLWEFADQGVTLSLKVVAAAPTRTSEQQPGLVLEAA